MPTAQTIVEYGKISQFIAANNTAKGRVFDRGILDADLPEKINLVWTSLGHIVAKDPTNTGIVATQNFLQSLCGKYALQASAAVGNSGGQVIEPPTGLTAAIIAVYEQFVVGETGSLMDAGDTVLSLSLADVLIDSISVTKDSVPLPIGLNNQQSFSVVYNPSSIVITFNEAVQDDQLFIVRGLRYINQ